MYSGPTDYDITVNYCDFPGSTFRNCKNLGGNGESKKGEKRGRVHGGEKGQGKRGNDENVTTLR